MADAQKKSSPFMTLLIAAILIAVFFVLFQSQKNAPKNEGKYPSGAPYSEGPSGPPAVKGPNAQPPK